ncbi:MAG: hypothetical protein NW216_08840 [Hyphomicrobium sp.]|nr:hypothetical protein [Hyphomicrobium sp.]
MGGVFYVHRFSKSLDEMVRELGMTLVISDRTSGVDLTPHVSTLQDLSKSLGIAMRVVQGDGGKIAIEFTPR